MPVMPSPPLSPPPVSDAGAWTIPRMLARWLDVNPVTKLTRTQSFITLPAFNVPFTWLGYSDIVAAFNFEGPNNFSLTSLLKELPLYPNYLLCISWRTVSGIVYRYALWNNVGEVFYCEPPPLYTGQLIKKNFRLEIWSTAQGSPALNVTPVNFYTSKLGGVDYRWGNDFSLVNADSIVTNFSIGTITKAGELLISGAGTSLFNGAYYLAGQYLGNNYYIMEGYPNVNPILNETPMIFSAGSFWTISHTDAGTGNTLFYYSTDFPATPDLVTTWNHGAFAISPLPTVTNYTSIFALPFTWPVGSYSASNPDSINVVRVVSSSSLPAYLVNNPNVIVYYISTTQLVPYVNGALPNPNNVNLPAWGYDPNGALPTKGWNQSLQQWE